MGLRSGFAEPSVCARQVCWFVIVSPYVDTGVVLAVCVMICLCVGGFRERVLLFESGECWSGDAAVHLS